MQVSIELYAKQKGRWLIDATYPGHQETIAVEEAKEMSALKHVEAVKVVKEKYDPATGHKEEKIVFTTEPEKSAEDYQIDSSDKDSTESEDSQGESEDLQGESEDLQDNWADDSDEEFDDNSIDLDSESKVSSKSKQKHKKIKPNAPELESKVGLIVKLLMIVVFSVGFAAIVTLLFQSFGMGLYSYFGISF